MPTTIAIIRRKPRRPQIEQETPLVAIAVARQVLEEASRYLGVPLPARYAAGLAFRAHRCYAHSPSFREKIDRPGNAGRDLLYVFMRHWLAARLQVERPRLFARLPRGYCVGEPLPPYFPPCASAAARPMVPLSNHAGLRSDFC